LINKTEIESNISVARAQWNLLEIPSAHEVQKHNHTRIIEIKNKKHKRDRPRMDHLMFLFVRGH